MGALGDLINRILAFVENILSPAPTEPLPIIEPYNPPTYTPAPVTPAPTEPQPTQPMQPEPPMLDLYVPSNPEPLPTPTDEAPPAIPPLPADPASPEPDPNIKPTYISVVLTLLDAENNQPLQGVTVTPNFDGHTPRVTDTQGQCIMKAMRPASAPYYTGYNTVANYAASISKAGYRGGMIPITVTASDPETKPLTFYMMRGA